MTYKTLYKYASGMNHADFTEKLYHCNASYTGGTNPHYVFLKSYNTVVAVFDRENMTVIRFGKYSNTTYQHMRKFRNKMWELYADKLTYKPWDIKEIQLDYENWYK